MTMKNEDGEPSQGEIIPYAQPAYPRVYQPIPVRRRSMVPTIAIGLLVLSVGVAAGYVLGGWRLSPLTGSGATVSDSVAVTAFRDTAGVVRAGTPQPDVPVDPPTFVEQPPIVPIVDTVVTTTTVEVSGYQTLTPPTEPPATIAPPIPDQMTLAGLLYGQRVTAKTAFGNYIWTVEPGEIIEFQVDRVWNDPAAISMGAYVTFVAMADGRGVRASGLLRYNKADDEAGAYIVRDFMPSRVVRVGSW